MEYVGQRQGVGTKAEDLDPKVALLQEINDAVSKPPMVSIAINRGVEVPEAPVGKVGQKEAWYVADGPYPIVCGGCNFFVYEDGCDLVKGKISPQGSCRYWRSR